MHIHLSKREQFDVLVKTLSGMSCVVYAAQDAIPRPVVDEKGDLKRRVVGVHGGLVEEILTEPHSPVHAVGFMWPSGAVLHVSHPQVEIADLLAVFPQALRVDSIHP